MLFRSLPQPLDIDFVKDEIYDVTNFGSGCPRFSNFYRKFLGSEDCLYLNVYVPKVSRRFFDRFPSNEEMNCLNT